MVTWKLREYLDRHEVSAYALAQATDLAPSTVYALARGRQRRTDLDVLDKVIEALEQLTGERVSVSDLLERDDETYEFPGEVPADIRERIERFERGETKLIPAGDIAAKYGVKR